MPADADAVIEQLRDALADRDQELARVEARLDAVVRAAENVARRIPSPFADNVVSAVRAAALSVAPQPEPECAECNHEPGCACADTPTPDGCRTCLTEPPASDEPARCEHGESGPHVYFVDGDRYECPDPGPVAPQPQPEADRAR